jgi:hypothetical protein
VLSSEKTFDVIFLNYSIDLEKRVSVFYVQKSQVTVKEKRDGVAYKATFAVAL